MTYARITLRPRPLTVAGREYDVHAQLAYEDADGQRQTAWGGLMLAPVDLPDEPATLRLPTGEQRTLHNMAVQRRRHDAVVSFQPPRRPVEYPSRGALTV